jgi:hypothetical protein
MEAEYSLSGISSSRPKGLVHYLFPPIRKVDYSLAGFRFISTEKNTENSGGVIG